MLNEARQQLPHSLMWLMMPPFKLFSGCCLRCRRSWSVPTMPTFDSWGDCYWCGRCFPPISRSWSRMTIPWPAKVWVFYNSGDWTQFFICWHSFTRQYSITRRPLHSPLPFGVPHLVVKHISRASLKGFFVSFGHIQCISVREHLAMIAAFPKHFALEDQFWQKTVVSPLTSHSGIIIESAILTRNVTNKIISMLSILVGEKSLMWERAARDHTEYKFELWDTTKWGHVEQKLSVFDISAHFALYWDDKHIKTKLKLDQINSDDVSVSLRSLSVTHISSVQLICFAAQLPLAYTAIKLSFESTVLSHQS